MTIEELLSSLSFTLLWLNPPVFSIICENLAVISMWGGDWYDFYIVEKENEPADTEEEAETQQLVQMI